MIQQHKAPRLGGGTASEPVEINYFQPTYRGRNWSVILVFFAVVPIPLTVAWLLLL